MADKPTRLQVLAPEDRDAIKKRADEERAEIRRAGMEHGHALGIYHARRVRDVACVALGALIGLAFGALGTAALYDRGMFTGGAIAGGVLEKTVGEPAAPMTVISAEEWSRLQKEGPPDVESVESKAADPARRR